MTNQLEALITKIRKQTKNFDTVILKEDEALSLIAALEQSQRRVAELESALSVARQPKMFIDGDISPADAEKLANIITEWVEEDKPSQLVVKLPELCVGVVQNGKAVMVPYAGGHWLNKTAMMEALRSAGINVQGDE